LAQAPLYGFTPPHFAVAGLATQALIRNRKTSVTLERYMQLVLS